MTKLLYTFFVACVLQLMQTLLAASVAPSWTISNQIEIGTFSHSQTPNPQATTPTIRNPTVTYRAALRYTPRNVALSIVDWNIQADEAGKSIFEIFVDLSSGSVSQTSFSLTVLFNILTSLRINYLVVDPSFTAVSVFVFRSIQTFTKTGPFIQQRIIPISGTSISQSLSEVLPFINGFRLRNSQNILNITAWAKQTADNKINLTFSSDEQNMVIEANPIFSLLLVNKDKLQLARFGSQTGSISYSTGQTFTFQLSQAPYIEGAVIFGLSSFYFTEKNMQFSTVLGKSTLLNLNLPGPKYLQFGYLSAPVLSCPQTNKYYDLNTSSCYDECPVGRYGDAKLLLCIDCLKYCLTCSAFETCTNCDPNQFRQLKGSSCVPIAGYYESGDVIARKCSDQINFCVTCSDGQTCTNCITGYFIDAKKCTICPSNCSACSSGTLCTKCKSGYFLKNGVCDTCKITVPGCAICLSGAETICQTCRVGFYKNERNTCTKCSDVLSQCSTCSYSQACNTCFPGSYINDQRTCTYCSSSIDGCSTCMNSTYCTNCTQGFLLNKENTCSVCSQFMPGCFYCTVSTACNKCNTNFYINGDNTCTNCSDAIEGCLTCNNASYCSNCITGYYQDNRNLCTVCPETCISCLNAQICTFCKDGFPPIDGVCPKSCKQFVKNCEVCSNRTACSKCISGYYLDPAGECSQCSSNCLTCSSTQCSKCESGYFKDKGQCSQCQQNCDTCTSPDVCTRCMNDFFLQDASCYPCSNINNCTSCSPTSKTCTDCSQRYFVSNGVCEFCQSQNCKFCEAKDNCTQCMDNSYKDGTVCVRCPKGCTSCANQTFCNGCDNGFYHDNQSKLCLACINLHIECISCSTANPICLDCNISFYASGNTCQKCPENCSDCVTSTNCTSCVVGFYQRVGECIQCPEGCVNCTNETSCNECVNESYYLDGEICKNCNVTLQCEKCYNDTGVCFDCQSGYYLEEDKSCGQCQANCQACTDQNTCTSCHNNTYLNNTDCILCSNLSCDTCRPNNQGCINCTAGHYLQDNKTCIPCQDENCDNCTGQRICSKCKQAWYVNNDKSCSSCPQECKICTSETNCSSCTVGYFLQGLDCKSCSDIENCTACNQTKRQCTQCSDGFYINYQGTCSSCYDFNCLKCDDQNSCSECLDGYFLENGQCKQCSSNCTLCNITQNNCSACNQGFFYDGNFSCLECAQIPDCAVCNTTQKECIFCDLGRYLESGICSSCSSNCEECVDSNTCQLCQQTYYLKTDKVDVSKVTCQQCLSPCVTCQATKCLSCLTGYYFNGSQCVPCKNGCINCTQDSCFECSTNYFLQDQQCKPCEGQCATCSTDHRCQSCNVGFYLYNNTVCQKCSSSINYCKQCNQTDQILLCTKCDFGKYLLNGGQECGSCSIGCAECTSNTACQRCRTAYFKQENQTCTLCSKIYTNCLGNCTRSPIKCNRCATGTQFNQDLQKCLSSPA